MIDHPTTEVETEESDLHSRLKGKIEKWRMTRTPREGSYYEAAQEIEEVLEEYE